MTTGEWRWKILCLPKVLAHRVKATAEQIFPADAFPFAEALMLGDKRALYNAELDVPLRNAGIMHAVAVSGMHLAFLIGAVQLLFGRRRFLSLLSLPLLGFFALMAGATPSVLRAGLMAALVLLAPALERENDPATSLMAALLLHIEGAMTLGFFLIWLVMYLIYRRQVRELNELRAQMDRPEEEQNRNTAEI